MQRATTLDRPIKRRAPPPPVRGETLTQRPPADSRPPLSSRPPSGRCLKRPTMPPPPPPLKVFDSRFGSQRSVMGSQSSMIGSQNNGSQNFGSQNLGSQNSLGYIRPVLKRTLSMPLRRSATKHPELQIPSLYDFSRKFLDQYELDEYYV